MALPHRRAFGPDSLLSESRTSRPSKLLWLGGGKDEDEGMLD